MQEFFSSFICQPTASFLYTDVASGKISYAWTASLAATDSHISSPYPVVLQAIHLGKGMFERMRTHSHIRNASFLSVLAQCGLKRAYSQ